MTRHRAADEPSPPAVSFVVDEQDALDHGDGSERRRVVLPEGWWPAGGAAAIAGLVLVLVAWLGASPLVTAVATLFPVGEHQVGDPDPSNPYGNSTYYGVAPGLIPVVSFGVRAGVVLIALLLGLRARHVERSALAGGCVAAAGLSLLLFVVAAVLMEIGIAMGHGASFYGVF